MFTRLQTPCRLLTAQLTDLLAAACSGGAFRDIRYRLPTWERTLELYAAQLLDQVLTGLTMVCLCQLLKYHSGQSRLLLSRPMEYDFADIRKPLAPRLLCAKGQCPKSANLDAKTMWWLVLLGLLVVPRSGSVRTIPVTSTSLYVREAALDTTSNLMRRMQY